MQFREIAVDGAERLKISMPFFPLKVLVLEKQDEKTSEKKTLCKYVCIQVVQGVTLSSNLKDLNFCICFIEY